MSRRPVQIGRQTLTFVTVTEDLADVDRYGNAATIRTTTDVPGCHFRPLKSDEKIDLGVVVADPWKATCPPVPAVLAAGPDDEVLVHGITYQIVGLPRLFTDAVGAQYKVTLICKRVTA